MIQSTNSLRVASALTNQRYRGFGPYIVPSRGDEWSLRAFASMPSTAIFLRARTEIKNLLYELASNAKIWGARASEHSFKFCEQIEQR